MSLACQHLTIHQPERLTMRNLTESRLTDDDRSAIVSAMTSHYCSMTPDDAGRRADWPTVSPALLSVGAAAIGCTHHSLRDSELDFIKHKARNIVTAYR